MAAGNAAAEGGFVQRFRVVASTRFRWSLALYTKNNGSRERSECNERSDRCGAAATVWPPYLYVPA